MANKSLYERLLSAQCHISCTGSRIYNLMRMVGQGEIKAENALLQMVEDYKINRDNIEELREISRDVDAMERLQIDKVIAPFVGELRAMKGKPKNVAMRMSEAVMTAIMKQHDLIKAEGK